MAILNPSFEDAGALPGEAEHWVLQTVTGAERIAGFRVTPRGDIASAEHVPALCIVGILTQALGEARHHLLDRGQRRVRSDIGGPGRHGQIDCERQRWEHAGGREPGERPPAAVPPLTPERHEHETQRSQRQYAGGDPETDHDASSSVSAWFMRERSMRTKTAPPISSSIAGAPQSAHVVGRSGGR